jgi:hypothetical protein
MTETASARVPTLPGRHHKWNGRARDVPSDPTRRMPPSRVGVARREAPQRVSDIRSKAWEPLTDRGTRTRRPDPWSRLRTAQSQSASKVLRKRSILRKYSPQVVGWYSATRPRISNAALLPSANMETSASQPGPSVGSR